MVSHMNISPEFLPVLVLAFGALLLFLQDVLLEDVTLSRLISIALLLCTTVLSLLLIQSHSHAYIAGDSFLFDSFSQIFGVVFSLSALLVVLTDSQFLKRLSSPFEFYVLVVLATLGMYFVAASTNLIALFVAFEMSTVATYAMTLFDKNNPHSAEAAIKFFVVGALSAGIILYAISLVYLATGSIDLKPSFALISPSASRLLAIGFVLLIVGFGFKVAAVPFHLWLPDTYDGAPYATTTYLASASKVMGFAALFKDISHNGTERASAFTLRVACFVCGAVHCHDERRESRGARSNKSKKNARLLKHFAIRLHPHRACASFKLLLRGFDILCVELRGVKGWVVHRRGLFRNKVWG
ncbi:hypothetical protein B9P99_05370 [Candidatus Marsarchaeota G1 archaeon OSP_B]|jgi:NADH:ubiquinone oxidoreductase subunit 2 (chain N)|uniref:NADH:quinone oxidoreductase/Mrp antiporter transmembrane domain-containing protein n=1 Tax=Candidatus Marsarchaeota G1 archaeon OSP_B TaxID=1978153 RepID=A0A2R6ATQ3_9ARCH|nr:MAG: hypothetical protein B9P99_05370 [Candidatus Marsarchaeota G1 archaeon OSP_B]